ncbi:hypothetical protein J8I29_15615 [Labrys sp. LIt4]|nr:hypothetical protein [Labrys sp. LIt4]
MDRSFCGIVPAGCDFSRKLQFFSRPCHEAPREG